MFSLSSACLFTLISKSLDCLPLPRASLFIERLHIDLCLIGRTADESRQFVNNFSVIRWKLGGGKKKEQRLIVVFSVSVVKGMTDVFD